MNYQNNNSKIIGIMGGSFNPIHNGHLILAEKAYKQYNIPKIIFIPAGVPYFKNHDGIVSAEMRCEMVRLAIDKFDYMELSTIEVERKGNTYTADTLHLLRNTNDIIYFIIGADSLFDIDRWKDPEYILSNCILLAANRGNHNTEDLNKHIDYLKEKFNADIHIINMDKCPISSTMVRDSLLNNKNNAKNMIPKPVFDYIIDKHLYEK